MNDDMHEIAGTAVPKADWEATPASIQMVVRVLHERLSALEEQLRQNSQNSSKPPSGDGFAKATKPSKPRQQSGKSRRHQTPRQVRKLTPSEECDAVHEVIPGQCSQCGNALSGKDIRPHRHQVVELPPVIPVVTEYQLHQLRCECCGSQTRAQIPPGVSTTGHGERLTALASLLSGDYHLSYRQVCGLIEAVSGLHLSRGVVGRLRQEMSAALAPVVAEAHVYVQHQAVLHSDETSYSQGNQDGLNPDERQGWLWGLITPAVSVFAVVLSRAQTSAKALIGEAFAGIVTSDRYGGYHWLDNEQRQLCWAHLKRDFTAMAERSGVSKEIGDALLARERRLFRWWHQVRDGTLSRADFVERVDRLRTGFRVALETAAGLGVGPREKTPLAKTVRTCQQLLKVEPALWTFVYTPDVEPTNNAAERALRPAVIWRRLSFGSQSQAGSEFVARMLSVLTSLQAQERDALAFLTEACAAARLGQPAPSLIPQME